jgi:hypothetical protein
MHHLPGYLQPVVVPFAALAVDLSRGRPCAERTVALRKLLEAKDAAVRAAVEDDSPVAPAAWPSESGTAR